MTTEMPHHAAPSKEQDAFLAMACRLSLLDDETAKRLSAEGRASSVSTAELALRQGLLDAIQIDIVETLLRPDDSIPGYEIQAVVGQGGMGVVYRARQKSLDRVVAVKTILVSQMHDQTILARFEQEAVAVAKLRHPNIVTAYDLGRHVGKLYFVMELIEGEDVERTIEAEGPLDEGSAWALIRQAAAGLAHAASAGIVHRDIKPANLLLVEPPAGFEIAGGRKMVKITDFGLAFLTQDAEVKTRLTQANTTIGSPHYLAPEQLERDTFDHRVDIYALGATAYHMLTGEPPFQGKKLHQVIAQKLAAEALDVREKAPQVSARSAELVRRMTARDPDRRLGRYAELFAAIDAVPATGLKSTATLRHPRPRSMDPTQIIRSDPTPESLAMARAEIRPRPALWHGRRRFLWSVGGGIVGVLGLGAGAWWISRRSVPTESILLVPTGLGVNLFDGLSLAGWRTQMGAWTVRRNSEGGRVLSGTDGRSRHALVNQLGSKKTELKRFRLSVVVQLHGASAAEIEFGGDDLDEDGERLVARLDKSGCGIGRRKSDFRSPFVGLSDPKHLPGSATEPHTLSVERQPGFWRVLLDDNPVGTALVPAGRREAPWFTLVAEGGEVWFSDITLQELGVPQPGNRHAD